MMKLSGGIFKNPLRTKRKSDASISDKTNNKASKEKDNTENLEPTLSEDEDDVSIASFSLRPCTHSTRGNTNRGHLPFRDGGDNHSSSDSFLKDDGDQCDENNEEKETKKQNNEEKETKKQEVSKKSVLQYLRKMEKMESTRTFRTVTTVEEDEAEDDEIHASDHFRTFFKQAEKAAEAEAMAIMKEGSSSSSSNNNTNTNNRSLSKSPKARKSKKVKRAEAMSDLPLVSSSSPGKLKKKKKKKSISGFLLTNDSSLIVGLNDDEPKKKRKSGTAKKTADTRLSISVDLPQSFRDLDEEQGDTELNNQRAKPPKIRRKPKKRRSSVESSKGEQPKKRNSVDSSKSSSSQPKRFSSVGSSTAQPNKRQSSSGNSAKSQSPPNRFSSAGPKLRRHWRSPLPNVDASPYQMKNVDVPSDEVPESSTGIHSSDNTEPKDKTTISDKPSGNSNKNHTSANEESMTSSLPSSSSSSYPILEPASAAPDTTSDSNNDDKADQNQEPPIALNPAEADELNGSSTDIIIPPSSVANELHDSAYIIDLPEVDESSPPEANEMQDSIQMNHEMEDVANTPITKMTEIISMSPPKSTELQDGTDLKNDVIWAVVPTPAPAPAPLPVPVPVPVSVSVPDASKSMEPEPPQQVTPRSSPRLTLAERRKRKQDTLDKLARAFNDYESKVDEEISSFHLRQHEEQQQSQPSSSRELLLLKEETKQKEELQSQVQQLQKELDKANGERRSSTSELGDLKAKMQKLEMKNKQLQQENAHHEETIYSLRLSEKEMKRKILLGAKAQGELLLLRSTLSSKTSMVQELSSELVKAKQELDAMREDTGIAFLQKQVANLEDAKKDFSAEIDRLAKELERTKQELHAATGANTSTTAASSSWFQRPSLSFNHAQQELPADEQTTKGSSWWSRSFNSAGEAAANTNNVKGSRKEMDIIDIVDKSDRPEFFQRATNLGILDD